MHVAMLTALLVDTSINSEAFASEFIENIEELFFSRQSMHKTLCFIELTLSQKWKDHDC